MSARFGAACLSLAVTLGLIGFAAAQEKGKGTSNSKPDSAPSQPETKTKSADEKEKTADTAKSTTDATDKEKPGAMKKPKSELATFGGGCFWCQEAVFERIPGVKSVVSGFSGGSVVNPSYQMVCTGLTGHAEVIQIEFDPSILPYEKLLKVFWASHDPTTLNRQEDDFGTQYRSIILFHSEAQKQTAQKSYKELTARRAFREPIVTELVPFVAFYPAEEYHQDYYRKHRLEDYSQTYIVPKLKKLRTKLNLK